MRYVKGKEHGYENEFEFPKASLFYIRIFTPTSHADKIAAQNTNLIMNDNPWTL